MINNNIQDLLRSLAPHQGRAAPWINQLPRGGGLMSQNFPRNFGMAMTPNLGQAGGGLMTDFNMLARMLAGFRQPTQANQPQPQQPQATPLTPDQQHQMNARSSALAGPQNRFSRPMGVFFGK